MCVCVEHWSELLQCRLGCASKVNVFNATSEPLDDYFVEHYNYLQFAYHKRLLPVFQSTYCCFIVWYIVIIIYENYCFATAVN